MPSPLPLNIPRIRLGVMLSIVAMIPGPGVHGAPTRPTATRPDGVTITADLTPPRLMPPKYRFLGTSLPSGTIPNYLGSLQFMDGGYYTVDPAFAIGKYKGLYYLVPSNAQWGGPKGDRYGQFCGGNWSNPGREPVLDGGLDAACRDHDAAWGRGAAVYVLTGDINFQGALNRVRPRWQYEADYLAAAKRWIGCRVTKHVAVATAVEPQCALEGFREVLGGWASSKLIHH